MTTITTGPNGETLFDGMSVSEVIATLDAAVVWGEKTDRQIFEIAATALRHLNAQPDPMTVTGMLSWHHGKAYLGPFLCGEIECRLSDPPQYSLRMQEDMDDPDRPQFYPTEAAARDALVQAVKEAIES